MTRILPPPPDYNTPLPSPPVLPAAAAAPVAPLLAADPGNSRGRRGRPFAKGNPGKRPGTRNHASVLLERIFEGEAEAIGRVAVAMARGGDPTALREVLSRIYPPRRGRAVTLPGFPKIASIADVPAALAFLANATAKGLVTADEATGLATLLDRYVAAMDAIDSAARLEAIERAQDEAEKA